MKAKELITKVLVGNPKTIVSVFAVMLLICGIQGIGYAQAPEFTGDEVTVTRSISENLPNTNVGVVLNVTPGDIPLNDLHYDFGDPGNLDFASFRLIAVADGVQLKTRAGLDYERQTDYEVIIRVRDNIANNVGGRAREVDDEITVIITVTNVLVADGDTAVANSAPAFNEGTSTTLSVDENTAADMNIGAAPVAAMKATGAEDDSADTLTYDLRRGADAASFDIDSMTGQLKAKAPLDYETKTSYMVIVTVTDGKNAEDNVDPAVDDTIRVTIMVTDVNEAPAFATKTATRSVAENTVVEANIGNPVVATDDDGDTLAYSLGGTHATSFAIDEETGQLKTKAALDYETQTDYEVTVTARDRANLMGEITVTINVRNVSVGDTEVANSAPAFNDGPSTTREVDENTKAKANIGAPVAARDVDRGDTLTYTLGGARCHVV